MSPRPVDVFFYGLFMDADVLRQAGVSPSNPRHAFVDGFALRIGERATLAPCPGARAYGMLYALTYADVERLYNASGLDSYHPEAVIALSLDGATVAALCYNLDRAPEPDERNPEYAQRLQSVLTQLGFPSDYVASIG